MGRRWPVGGDSPRGGGRGGAGAGAGCSARRGRSLPGAALTLPRRRGDWEPPRWGRARLRFNLRLGRDYGRRIVSNPRHRPPGAARPSPQQRHRRRGGQVNFSPTPSQFLPVSPDARTPVLFAFSFGKLRAWRLPRVWTPRFPFFRRPSPLLNLHPYPSRFTLCPAPLSSPSLALSTIPRSPPPSRSPPGAEQAGSGLGGSNSPGRWQRPEVVCFAFILPLPSPAAETRPRMGNKSCEGKAKAEPCLASSPP